MPGTAVIIPYFQRVPGVLAAAVRSALAQEGAGPITIVVCDDGSPVPGDVVLATLDAAERQRVVLIRQTNAGAGPARNAALDAVPPDTEWIAFLDSDDRWGGQHLARAIAALREGYDLCFADALREPQTLTHFQGAAFVRWSPFFGQVVKLGSPL
jgi:succinoglycan biosynthesis protein ExoW